MSRQKERSRARKLALQALYQFHYNNLDEQKLIDQFHLEHHKLQVDWELFTSLVRGVLMKKDECDQQLAPLLSRKVSELDTIELQLLRLGAYELQHIPETPTLSIIDDAIHLARSFGAQDSYKMINAVLDKLVRTMEWRKNDLHDTSDNTS